jgi:flagellar hook-basal body complex protein FliE
MATPGIAAQAYSQIARIASDPSKAGGAGGGTGGIAGISDKSFGDMLKTAIGSVVETGKKSDAQVQAVAAGKANVVDVVAAVAETEVAVDALVAVRDKVIQAYEEIMRMPI